MPEGDQAMITTLTGKNEYALQVRLDGIKQAWQDKHPDIEAETYLAEEITDPNSFINDLQTVGLFSTERMVVIRHLSDNKDLIDLIEKFGSRVPSDAELVIYDPNFDLRTRVAKWLKANSDWHDEKPLDRFALQRWLKGYLEDKKVALDTKLQMKLLDMVASDQLRLAHEVDKLALVQGKIDETVLSDLVPRTLEDNIFDLLDAICRGQTKRATAIIDDFKMTKVDPHYVFNMLVWQINVVALSLSSTKPVDEIAAAVDMKPGALSRARSLRADLPPKRLKGMISALAEIDVAIKQGEAWPQIDRLLFL